MKREKEKLKARQIIGFGWAWTWVCAQQCGCVCSAGACAQGHLSGEPGLALPGTSLVQVTGGLCLPVLPFSEPRESKKRVYWQNMISALGSHSYQPWGTLTWLLCCSGIIIDVFWFYHIISCYWASSAWQQSTIFDGIGHEHAAYGEEDRVSFTIPVKAPQNRESPTDI